MVIPPASSMDCPGLALPPLRGCVHCCQDIPDRYTSTAATHMNDLLNNMTTSGYVNVLHACQFWTAHRLLLVPECDSNMVTRKAHRHEDTNMNENSMTSYFTGRTVT
jgi:hypothetical protein